VSVDAQIIKRLGNFTVDAHFSAPEGITALFGPSGSGKTSTLRAIAGLLHPDRGRVQVNGRLLFDSMGRIDVPARDRRVGYLFQQYALFPHLRVTANVGYGLNHLSAGERDARVASLLEMVELPDLADRYPGDLSGGQQQRVALARALAPSPDLLLLDEPFAAVDALARAQLRRELALIQEQTGMPMLLVTHDLAEVRQLASFLVLYYDGHVLQQGPTAEVLAAPTSAEAVALLEAAGA